MTSSDAERISRPTEGQTERDTHKERDTTTQHTQRDNDTMMIQQNNTQERQTHRETPRGGVV